MGSRMLSRFVAAMALALACSADCRAAPAVSEMPEGFVVASVAQHLRINGLDIEISALSSAVSPERACALLAHRWRRASDSGPLDCRKAGAWLLITRCVGRRERTVQLRAANDGTTGYLSELDVGARPATPPTPRLPLPSGARVLSVLQSSEPDGEIAQFTVGMPLPPAMALQQLRSGAVAHRWKVALPSYAASESKMLDFSHGPDDIRAIVVPVTGGSSVVLIERHTALRQP